MAKPTRRGLTGASLKWKQILLLDLCPYCGERLSQTIDHIYPLARVTRPGILPFGPNNWRNLTGACMVCNREKKNRTLLVHLVVTNLRRASNCTG